MNYFSENLECLRKQKNLTQLDLAKKLNKDYTTIGKWEKGERTPKLNDVIKIAEYFNLSLDNLVTKSFNKENN